MRFLLPFILLVACSEPVWAGAWSHGCQFSGGTVTGTIGTPASTKKQINEGDVGCYRFNAADGLHFSSATAHGTVVLKLAASTSVVTLDPQLDAETAAPTATTATLLFCPQGAPVDTANPNLSCISVGGAGAAIALDGVEGPVDTQNASIRVGPGVWIIEVTGACAANETCQVAIQGEQALN